MANLVDEELKIVNKIDRFFNEYDFSILYEIQDIELGISELKGLIDKYEDVHFRLKRKLGDEVYKETYTAYEDQMTVVTRWIRDAKEEIRAKKVSETEKENDKVRAEERFFRKKIGDQLSIMSGENSTFVEDLEKNISEAQVLSRGYYDIFVKIEAMNLTKDYENVFEKENLALNAFIQETKKRVQDIKFEKIEKEKLNKCQNEVEKVKLEENKKIVLCSNIYDNICERFSSLEVRCGEDVTKLSDSDLLNEKRELKSLDSNFNLILDRITKLSEYNPDILKETSTFLSKIQDRKKKLKTSIDNFKTNVENEISVRDLSEEKMKNASILGIKLPKFKGYDSSIDYYTFKSEFDKLIVPRVQAQLLSDYLKKNYLEGQALELVKEIESLDDIWVRLKASYGNVETLMNKKLGELDKGVPLWKIKGDEKLIQSILKLKNSMLELKSLASKHNVEQILFHTSNLSKILNFLGRKRQIEITKIFLKSVKNEEQKWDDIVKFLDDEIKVKEQIILLEKPYLKGEEKPRKQDSSLSYTVSPVGKKCVICDQTDHVPTVTGYGKSIICYFACKKFAKMNPQQRFDELRKKKLCFQCLSPGKKAGHEGRCFDRYKCPKDSHKLHKSGLHVLICDQHKYEPENLKLLEDYKTKCIIEANETYEDFSNKISISFHAESYDVEPEEAINEDTSVYMLQTIKIGDRLLNIFFDSGCGDMLVRKGAVDFLEKYGKAKNVVKGPMIIGGVSNLKAVCEHGRYEVTIPLHNGKEIKLSGMCLETITNTFPTYPLGEIERDIGKDFVSSGGNRKKLPKLAKSVGGATDLMIGVQYLKYFPREIHRMDNGLSIYESMFKSADNSRGVVAGPHKSLNRVHKNGINHVDVSAYLCETTKIYRDVFWKNSHMGLLDIQHSSLNPYSFYSPGNLNEIKIEEEIYPIGFNDVNEISSVENIKQADESIVDRKIDEEMYLVKRVPKIVKMFEEVDKAGTEASYRCVNCRGCPQCKKSETIECISVQEEMEQALINKSVTVHLEEGYISAYLPFLCDPTKKLVTNYRIALKIFHSQVKRLNSASLKDKNDVIDGFQKLIDLGFIVKYGDLPENEKQIIDSNSVKYYIPWSAHWNTNSNSTPCRPVFNASCPTDSGYSLNDLLPKGRNSLNKLVQIFIRWLTYPCAFHTDIQKMYNTIRLEPKHWCYQLCLFESGLNVDVEPQVFVIKTVIYGVKTSGNQAERAVREIAKLCENEFPRQNEIIQNDLYMDDCFSGENSYKSANVVTDDMLNVLGKGGFRLKGITFSGFDPPEHLCNEDKKSVNVAGKKWFPAVDTISLNIGELNFLKKLRGKKDSKGNALPPEKFTRRGCAGRVGEIFDLNGRFTPLVVELKLDLHELSTRKLDWDEFVPPDLVSKWKDNFEKIAKLSEIKFRRCIIPEDAINLDMEMIAMGDSSLEMACSAVYIRMKRKNGLFSCQLVFAKSKIISDGMSIPRAELLAAALNATTSHVVHLSLGKLIKSRIWLSDSQIALFWISNKKLQSKQWVRNRVIEINRLTDIENWFHVEGKNMTADIGTRRGAKISDILDGSDWSSGQEWSKHDRNTFPIKSVNEIKLSKVDLEKYDAEMLKNDISEVEWVNDQLSQTYSENYAVIKEGALDNIGLRYTFSNYIVDPNKFRFRKVVRIVALVYLFVRNLKRKIGLSVLPVVAIDKTPDQLLFSNDKYLVTQNANFPFSCQNGLVVQISENNMNESFNYFAKKASLEIKHFRDKQYYKKLSVEKSDVLHYTGRILPSQKVDNKLQLVDVCSDLTMSSFCVPLIDKYSPLAYAIINEVHWFDDDAKHSGNETVMRYVQKIAHIIEGRPLIKMFRKECPRCRYLRKKAIEVAMGPMSCENLTIAPAHYYSQCDLFGPYSAYSNANKRATVKIWFVIFCCCVTGAIDIKVAEDYSTTSFIMAFTRFSCKVGYPRKLMPDAGSQLVKGCSSMKLVFSDIRNKLHEYGVDFEVSPVGGHNFHGKVERKIKHVQECFAKNLQNHRLSIIQWETLGDQIANSINNLPIALGNLTEGLENLDLLTPNRLLLARNNARCPMGPVIVTEDVGKIIQQNNTVFEVWFKSWLTSYVPTLMFQPKWFNSDYDPQVGDIILFLKSEKDFEKLYQYGVIVDLKRSRDEKIRQVEIEYQNHSEKVKRRTNRATRDIVVIHPHDELGLVRELNLLVASLS